MFWLPLLPTQPTNKFSRRDEASGASRYHHLQPQLFTTSSHPTSILKAGQTEANFSFFIQAVSLLFLLIDVLAATPTDTSNEQVLETRRCVSSLTLPYHQPQLFTTSSHPTPTLKPGRCCVSLTFSKLFFFFHHND